MGKNSSRENFDKTFPSIDATLLAWDKLHLSASPDTLEKCIDPPLQIYEYIIPNLKVLPWLQKKTY